MECVDIARLQALVEPLRLEGYSVLQTLVGTPGELADLLVATIKELRECRWVKSRRGREIVYTQIVDSSSVASHAARLIVYACGRYWYALARNKHRHICWMPTEAYFDTPEAAKEAAEKWLASDELRRRRPR